MLNKEFLSRFDIETELKKYNNFKRLYKKNKKLAVTFEFKNQTTMKEVK